METQSAFMTAAAAAVLLIAVLLRRRDGPALRYAALTMGLGLWSLGRGLDALGLGSGPPLYTVGLVLIGPAALAFTSTSSGAIAAERRLLPIVWAASPLLLLVALGAEIERPAWLGILLLAWAASGAVLSGRALWGGLPWRSEPLRRGAAADDTPEATRRRYLAYAHMLVVGGIALDLALWRLGAPRIATLAGGVIYLWAGYLQLVRVRIADLRQLLGDTLALVLLAGGLAGAFAALRVWVGPHLGLFVFNAFVASLLLLLFYEPGRRRIENVIERRFVAGKVELERALQPLPERLAQILSLDELLRELLATMERTARVTASSVYLREDPHLGFAQAAGIGLSPRPRVNLIREPTFVAALETGQALLYEDLEQALEDARSDGRRGELEQLCASLRELDAQLVVPLLTGDLLVGFWTLTDAKTREPFSSTEVKLLRSVADGVAVCVEKSKTFERIRARDRLVSLGEMAAGMAHELRNPLATIRGALAVLDESADGPPSELSCVVVEEVHRLDRVVGAFLDYAQPSLHRSPISDFEAFVRSCVAGAVRYGDRRVAVAIDVEGQIPPVTADRHQLETVIDNVVRNAYEALSSANPVAPHIRVSLRVDPAAEVGEGAGASRGDVTRRDPPRCVEIAVADNGPGMDDDTLERAFIPFYTTKERGSGLGLSLCERLIRVQGGNIGLRSKPGEGTVISIRLPLDGTEPTPAHPAADEGSAA
jgi:two-component system sensor histidine kinase HydH